MEEIKLYPIWKQAVKELIASGLTYGSALDKQRIIDLCELKRPETLAQNERFELRLMTCICEIKDALLTDHQMLLATNRNGSYRVVAPKEQTLFAIELGAKAIQKEMRRMSLGVQHVNTSLLDSEQRRKNSDAQAKISMLSGMQRTARTELCSIAAAA